LLELKRKSCVTQKDDLRRSLGSVERTQLA
jgi:hypothetical protein